MDFFQIFAYKSKTMHLTENFTLTKIKEHKISRRIMNLKKKQFSRFVTIDLQRYAIFTNLAEKWIMLIRWSQETTLQILELAPKIFSNWLKNEIGKVSS